MCHREAKWSIKAHGLLRARTSREASGIRAGGHHRFLVRLHGTCLYHGLWPIESLHVDKIQERRDVCRLLRLLQHRTFLAVNTSILHHGSMHPRPHPLRRHTFDAKAYPVLSRTSWGRERPVAAHESVSDSHVNLERPSAPIAAKIASHRTRLAFQDSMWLW